MSPGMWFALHNARLEELRIYDALQARISSTVASTIPRKSKTRIKESNFRLFSEEQKGVVGGKRNSAVQLFKMRAFAASAGLDVINA